MIDEFVDFSKEEKSDMNRQDRRNEEIYARIYYCAEIEDIPLEEMLYRADIGESGEQRFSCCGMLTHDELLSIASILKTSAEYLEFGMCDA